MDARNYFLDTAADEARKRVTEDGEPPAFDLVVYTTLEPKIQEAARKAATKHIREQGKRGRVSEAAVVVMKPDGAVSALIGGVDYEDSVFNRATLAKRQPGSSFKPFVYLAALESGLSPWEVRNDEPVDIHGWTPTNYGGRSYGVLTLIEALTHSVNTIAANLAQEVGIANVIDAAHRAGITSPLEQNASLALGTAEVTPLELTAAYATFASGGLRARPYFVRRIESASGRLLYQRKTPIQERVVASHVNKDLTMMMYSVVTQGTGRGAIIAGYEAAGKTGTTQDYHDAWFVGFTRDYVTGVWVGNDDNKPMRGITGGTLPALIWRDTMTVAEKGLTPRALERSPPEAPADSDLYNSGPSDGSTPVYPEDTEAPPPEPGQNGSFWDRLFGGEGRRPAPAVPPRNYTPPPPDYSQPPQQDRYAPQSYDQYAPRRTDPNE
jgi:penicillin-binding protein 1A